MNLIELRKEFFARKIDKFDANTEYEILHIKDGACVDNIDLGDYPFGNLSDKWTEENGLILTLNEVKKLEIEIE